MSLPPKPNRFRFRLFELLFNSKRQSLKQELEERTATFIFASLGVVTAFAWNDAFQSLIKYIFPLETSSLLAKFSYAVIITAIVVIVTVFGGRLLTKTDQK